GGLALLAASALAAAGLPAAASRPDLGAHHAPRRPGERSAVLIVIDTLRADRVSAYGHTVQTTPRMDRLAASGARFEAAYSSSSWTAPAVASLFSGLPLSRHGVSGIETPFTTSPTLAERLSGQGMVTAGFSANPLVSSLYGFERGFKTFVSSRSGLIHPVVGLSEGTMLGRFLSRPIDPDRMLVEQARTWLAAHAADRFFLYVHLMAPHRPYEPPEEFRGRMVEPYEGVEYQGGRPGEVLPGPALRNVLQRYDAEVAYADSLVGELLDTLSRLGLDRSTVVAVTSDHGEAFGEHGRWEHGQALYAEETRIPMMVRVPGAAPGRILKRPVSLMDLHPTLLALLDAPAGPAGLPEGYAGVDLTDAIHGRARTEPHPVLSEILGEKGTVHPETLDAVVLGDIRLIRNHTLGTQELFDVAADPGETQPLDRPSLVTTLQRYMAPAWWERATDLAGRTIKLSDEDVERLKSLGYIR
ncbi:MAG TPA: sulfatase, partial [Candidatus Polarisedimenticolia bacterium]|nr:sulfatase [Candidatus Polarisedimenticolia bacterium]